MENHDFRDTIVGIYQGEILDCLVQKLAARQKDTSNRYANVYLYARIFHEEEEEEEEPR